MSYDAITKTFEGVAAKQRQCWCGISFAIPLALSRYYERTNAAKPESFAIYCPLGHSMVPAGPSEAEKLRDELAREKHRTEQAKADADYQTTQRKLAERQVIARKGQITKLRKRISGGVCPCCNRQFGDLHRHMQGQHPDWRPEDESPERAVESQATWQPWAREAIAKLGGIDRAAELTGYAKGSITSIYYGHNESAAAREKIQKALDALPA